MSQVTEARDVRDLFDFFWPLHKRWEEDRTNFVFRGLTSARYQVLPAVFRAESQIYQIAQRFRQDPEGHQKLLEKVALSEFVSEAVRVGLAVPSGAWALLEVARNQSFGHLEPWPPAEMLECLALAQHAGLGNRLLDWSDDPMQALWFSSMGSNTGQRAVVALAPTKVRNERVEFVRPPRSHISTTHAQSSVMSVVRESTQAAQDLRMRAPRHLVEVHYPSSMLKDVREVLRAMGKDELTSFPRYDLVAEQVRRSGGHLRLKVLDNG